MKEASGELNMTLVTVVAVAIIGAIFAALYPAIKNTIQSKWEGSTSELDNARAGESSGAGTVGS